MQTTFVQARIMNLAFRGTLLLKGFYATLEIIAGAVVLFIPQMTILSFAEYLAKREDTSDPTDAIVDHLLQFANSISISTQHFVGTYLILHGIVKVILVVGLLQHKKWAYKAALTFFSLFILYDIYRFTHTHSVALLILAGFDLLIIILAVYDHYFGTISQRKK